MKTTSLRLKKMLTGMLMAGALLLAVASSATPDAGKTAAELRDLNFSHQLHGDQGLACDACHTTAAQSAAGTDDLLPGHPQCQDCHDVTASDNCGMCHRGDPGLSTRITQYSPKFSHAEHLGEAKLACAACHANLDAPLPAERVGHLPLMAECMDCHADRRVSNECRTCHLPTEDLVPTDHKVNWVYSHGAAASGETEACNVCHTTDDCQRCHNGDAIFSPHPRNYISRHGQDAHLSDLSCSSCHEERDFCNTCHSQLGVVPPGHFEPGWVTRDGGEHGERAEFDLESCMACHDAPGEEPVCARCHHE